MEKILLVLLLMGTSLLSSTLYASSKTLCKETQFQKADEVWTGHYYLNGVMETGSEMLLLPEGKFKWYLTYGALDQYAEGRWWKNGNCIGLKPERKYKKHLRIFPKHLKIEGKFLNVIWNSSGEHGYYHRVEE